MTPMRVAFFGTPAFAVPTLDALLASPHRVVAVVTQPDRPRGRGHKMSDAPVKARAIEAGLPVLQPNRLNDPAFVDAFNALNTDLAVVAAYGKILPESLIATPRHGMINVHASLLPKYRGAAPVHRAILNGESETGVTIMRVVKALDAGPMMAATRRPIGVDETSDMVESDLARLGAPLLVEVVNRLATADAAEAPQDESLATYAHRLSKDDGILDWTRSARQLHDQIRGLYPWPHAFTYLAGRRLILLRSAVEAGLPSAQPGTILECAGDRLAVATGAGTLLVLELQPEGKRPLGAREFLAGHRPPADARLSPASSS